MESIINGSTSGNTMEWFRFNPCCNGINHKRLFESQMVFR